MTLPEDLKHGARGRHPASIAAGVIAGVAVTMLIATDIAGCVNDELRAKLVEAQKKAEAAKRTNAETKNKLETAKRVNAYACGYLHGQRAIIQNARLRIQEPEFMDTCPQFTDEAISAGFNVARKNR